MPPADLLLGLTRRYCEPHRRYHAIGHVADMLWRGRELALSDAQVMAVWFHDAVYRVPADDNERCSAALAVAELTAAGWPRDQVALVERIVLDTEDHRPSCPESAAVVDLDLASLADEWQRFTANTAAIREEYACHDDERFRTGQRRLFEGLLGRQTIFHTPWGLELELAARANLHRALAAP